MDIPNQKYYLRVRRRLYPANDIREISYTIMKDGEEMTYFKRFIFRDNCMYQLTIGGKTEDLEELNSQRDKFFNSVKFDQNTRK